MMTDSQTGFQMNLKMIGPGLTRSFELLCPKAQLKKYRQARGSSEKVC
jgi:hypothetical protein